MKRRIGEAASGAGAAGAGQSPASAAFSPDISYLRVRSADFEPAFDVFATIEPTRSRRSGLLAFCAEHEISRPGRSAVQHSTTPTGKAGPALFPSRRDAAATLFWPFRRVVRLFVANQSKRLSMNHLDVKLSFPGQAQSRLIKANQVIFCPSIRPSSTVNPADEGKKDLGGAAAPPYRKLTGALIARRDSEAGGGRKTMAYFSHSWRQSKTV